MSQKDQATFITSFLSDYWSTTNDTVMVMSRNLKPFDCLGPTVAHENAGISPPLIGFEEGFQYELFPVYCTRLIKRQKKF